MELESIRIAILVLSITMTLCSIVSIIAQVLTGKKTNKVTNLMTVINKSLEASKKQLQEKYEEEVAMLGKESMETDMSVKEFQRRYNLIQQKYMEDIV